MVSVAYLDMNFSLLSEIMSRYKLNENQLQITEKILAPLGKDELDIGNSFRYELVWTTKTFRDELIRDTKTEDGEEDTFGRWIVRLSKTILFKPNATINDNYGRLSLLAKISGYSASDYLGHLIIDAPGIANSEIEFDYHFVYNPIGKLINMIGANHWLVLRYIKEPHNLDAKMRLISVKRNIYREGIRQKDVPAFLASLPSHLRNPYDGSIPSWEEKTGRIAFVIVSEKMDDLKGNPFSGTVIVKL